MTLQPFRLAVAGGHRLAGERGDGERPGYLFLHGLGATRGGEKSDPLLAHARSRGRAFARYDFRGHGDSTGVIGQVAIRDLIDDAIAVLEQVGPAAVVGSSFGGLIGAFAASRRPDLVAALALVAPAFGFLSNLERALDAEGRLWTVDGRCFPVAAAVLEDARTHDERALPGRLAMPVFVVHGDRDEVVPSRHSERFCAAVPHARKELWVVPGGDHRLDATTEQIWPRMDRVLFAPRA
ncbi:MAG: alpha/beta fold hydrolase [Planctomycetota bacterium]